MGVFHGKLILRIINIDFHLDRKITENHANYFERTKFIIGIGET